MPAGTLRRLHSAASASAFAGDAKRGIAGAEQLPEKAQTRTIHLCHAEDQS
jgi:hypothetical protein